jgi:hypothetical protein
MADQILVATKIIAPEIKMSGFLEEGEVDITDLPIDKIYSTLDKSETKKIIKKTKSYLYPVRHCPVCVYKTKFSFSRKKYLKAVEAGRNTFNNIEDMQNFLKQRNGTLVYQIIKIEIFPKYVLRYYDVEINFLKYWMNRLMLWG